MIVWIRGATTTVAVDLPEQESFFSSTTPAVTPAPRMSTTTVTRTAPSGNLRRGPPRRCDRTVEVRPYDGMGEASEGVNGACKPGTVYWLVKTSAPRPNC